MPKGLGKGLGALISGATGSQKTDESEKSTVKSGVLEVEIDKIIPNKYQPRKEFNPEKLTDLVASIKAKGILQPITVRKTADGYELIAGERRLRASKEAGFLKVPVIVKEVNNEDMLELSLIENIQRQDLNPIEEAQAYKQLIEEFKLTHEDISGRVGKERSTITNILRLLNLPGKIQDYVSRETISVGHARVLLGLEEIASQLDICEVIIGKGLSVRQTETLVSKTKKAKGKDLNSQIQKDIHVLDAEKQLQYTFGAKVRIRGAKKGKIEVYFNSMEELNRIYEIMSKMG